MSKLKEAINTNELLVIAGALLENEARRSIHYVPFSTMIYNQLKLDFTVKKYLIWFNDPKINRYLANRTPRDEIGIKEWILGRGSDATSLYFLIKNGLGPIGHIGASNIDRSQKTAEVAYLLGNETNHGWGILTTALGDFRTLLHREVDILRAKVQVGNEASMTVLRNNCFVQSGFIFTEEDREKIWFEAKTCRPITRQYYNLGPDSL